MESPGDRLVRRCWAKHEDLVARGEPDFKGLDVEANELVAAEREACAQLVEERVRAAEQVFSDVYGPYYKSDKLLAEIIFGKMLASGIRDRGENG